MNIFKQNKKINFRKDDLVLCRIGIVVNTQIEKVSNTNTSWDYSQKTTYLPIKEKRILIRYYGRYYEPEDHRYSYARKKDSFNTIGDKIVIETDNIPIQYIEEIPLTEKEKRRGKISFRRIKELENLLNSK